MQKKVPRFSISIFVRIMKLSAIILSVICSTVLNLKAFNTSAQAVLDKKITIELKNTSLQQALDKISDVAKVSFTYVGNTAMVESKVNLSAKNKRIGDLLDNILRPYPLSYTTVEDKIIIRYDPSKKEPLAVAPKAETREESPTTAPGGNIDVKGHVGDDKKAPLGNVTVAVKGSKRTTQTNDKGDFELKGVAVGSTLVFTMVGHKPFEVKLTASTPYLNIQLKEDAIGLDDVVVTGFQKIDRKKFTGSAVTLKADDVKIEGTTDVSRMLEGRAAGVSVQNVSGTFGAAPKVRVRGATSITGDNKPLWVIDGVVLEDIVNISNDQLSTGDPSTLLGSSVAGLNVNDIETFDILKDASAAALYGARAMNGVIVITTKKGKAGKSVISYTGNFGVQLKPSYNNYDIMNSADQMSVYAELERKGMLNYPDLVNAANSGVYGKLAQLIQRPDANGNFVVQNTPQARQAWLMRYANANTDWFGILFRNSLTQEHTLSISSGTDKVQTYFSTSFYYDPGWTIADNVKRYTVNARNNYNVSDKLSFGFLVNGSVRQQRSPGTENRSADSVAGGYSRAFDINPFSYSLNTSRVLTAYDQTGQLEYFTRNFAPFNIISETQNNFNKLSVLDIRLQGNLTYKITPHLNYDFVGGLRYAKTTNEHDVLDNSNEAEAYRENATSIINASNPYLYHDPTNPNLPAVVVLPYGGFYNRTDRQLLNYTFRNVLTYNQSFNDRKHQVTALVGQEIKSVDRQTASDMGVGYQYDNGGTPFLDYRFIKKMVESGSVYYGMTNEYDRTAAFFSNGSYTYNGKYTLQGTVRVDGSNKLGSSAKARWLPTWTLASAWNVDQEKFMQNVDVISHLMMKLSYGLNAGTGSATNSTAILRSAITNRPYTQDQQTEINIEALENSDLTWEKKHQLNVTADMGLWKERLTVVAEVYFNNSFDLIGPVRTSGIAGQAVQNANYADLKSHGVDFSVTGRIISKKNISWTSTFNLGYNVTKITNAKNDPSIWQLVQESGGAKEGYPVRGIFSIKNAGLDPKDGTPLFVNDSGNVGHAVYLQSLTGTQYLQYEGPIDPTFVGGFNNTVRYKQFSLSVLLTYQAGNKVRLTPQYASSYSDLDALPNEFKRRWTLPGDEKLTNIPSIASLYPTQFSLANATAYPYNNYNYSHDRVANGDFVRLKAVTLNYALPADLINHIGFKTASFSVTANNLWLIYSDKHLHGQDPEFFNTGGVAMPINKQVTVSLKVGL